MHLTADSSNVRYFGAELKNCKTIVILLHGRRQRPEDMYALAERFNLPEVAYIIPLAAELTWYPHSFMRELEHNESHLQTAFSRIDELIQMSLNNGIDEKSIFLMGFSQGACIASQYLLERRRRIGGMIAFTGGVFGPGPLSMDIEADYLNSSLQGVKVFITGSETDTWVPAGRVRKTARIFEAMGAEVTSVVYADRDHIIVTDEIDQAKTLLAA
jgi:phospholipase/carboxylesterase